MSKTENDAIAAVRGQGMEKDERAAAVSTIRQLWREGVESGEAQDRETLKEFLKTARRRRGFDSVED